MFTHQLPSQIDQNTKYQDRVRKAIQNRPRNAVVGGDAAADVAGRADASADDEARRRNERDIAADADDDENQDPNAAADVDVVLLPASRAPPPIVAPPERWCDAHINWRHPLTFVFVLNGPLTFFHPSAGHRQVCEFLKKVPRSGPQDVVRQVSRDDSRRRQRAADRTEVQSEVAGQNGELLQALQASRCTSAVALYTAHSCFTGWPKPPLPARQTL